MTKELTSRCRLVKLDNCSCLRVRTNQKPSFNHTLDNITTVVQTRLLIYVSQCPDIQNKRDIKRCHVNNTKMIISSWHVPSCWLSLVIQFSCCFYSCGYRVFPPPYTCIFRVYLPVKETKHTLNKAKDDGCHRQQLNLHLENTSQSFELYSIKSRMFKCLWIQYEASV